jgi:hypothetical protein
VLDDVDDERRRGLGLGKPHELHVATRASREPSRQSSQPPHPRIVQRNDHVEIRAIVIAPRSGSAKQDREPDVWLRSKRARSARSTPQWPRR